MAGPKKNRQKKRAPTPPPPMMNQEDTELMEDLLAQLDSRDEIVQTESANVLNEMNLNTQANTIDANPRQDAKSRFKARQARKAAALAQSYAPDDPAVQVRLEKEAKEEEESIRKTCQQLSLHVHEINPNGHCLFSAVADQLALMGAISPAEANYTNIRTIAANYIYSHPDDFLPFLPSDGGEDTAGALDAGMMTQEQFNNYCIAMRDTANWGGEPEIVALSRAFNTPIHVVQGGQPPIVVHDPTGDQKAENLTNPRVIRISYHRRLYGLGEHYNSLRRKQPI